MRWEKEQIYFGGDEFFEELLADLGSAQRSIVLESYIYERDSLGRRVLDALISAAKRGVRVRVVVDAVGSSGWRESYGAELASAGGSFKIFHEFPWSLSKRPVLRLPSVQRLFQLARRFNRRDHRKLILVDEGRAWIGSMNITDVHLQSLKGEEAWRDTGLMIEGEGVECLLAAFERAWLPWKKRARTPAPLTPAPASALLRLNHTRRQRKRNYKDLLSRLRNAQNHIWITTPYFVPNGQLVDALTTAAQRGVDVRILVPAKSDVFFMPWVAAAFRVGLLRAGARVFVYLPRVLHAKTLEIDSWATVGSSNFNHRSLFHDLEVDAVLTHEETRARLHEQFLVDLGESEEKTFENWSPRSRIVELIGKILLLFRQWL